MNLGRMFSQKDWKSQTPVCGRNEHTEFCAWEKALRFVQNRKREHSIKLRRAMRWAGLGAAQEGIGVTCTFGIGSNKTKMKL